MLRLCTVCSIPMRRGAPYPTPGRNSTTQMLRCTKCGRVLRIIREADSGENVIAAIAE